jgi:hypothetical protein
VERLLFPNLNLAGVFEISTIETDNHSKITHSSMHVIESWWLPTARVKQTSLSLTRCLLCLISSTTTGK